MGQGHSHGEAQGNYLLDQICTVAVCGAIGAVAVLMYTNDRLRIILVPAFERPVLVGGIALLVLAFIRAVSLWQMVGRDKPMDPEAGPAEAEHADDHGHDHGDAHSHSHGHDHDRHHGHDDGNCQGHEHGGAHSHSHGHDHGKHREHNHEHAHAHGHSHGGDGHEHAWAPWRYIVLLLPVLLYALNLPNQGYSNERLGKELGSAKLEGGSNHRLAVAAVAGGPYTAASKKQRVTTMRFNELALAALRPATRAHYDGQTVRLKGMFFPQTDKEFSLFRMKMNCCVADAVPLQARIICPVTLQKFQPREWVEVEGELTFRQVAGRNEWVPVILLDSDRQITPVEADSNEYEAI